MEQAVPIEHPSHVAVADRVAFKRHKRDCFGYIQKKGRKYAYVVCDDGSECKVPYSLLSKIPHAPRRHVRSQSEILRCQFHINDRVEFTFRQHLYQGIIVRLNPKRAHVICDDEQEFQVPYTGLVCQNRSEGSLKQQTASQEDIFRDTTRLAYSLLRQYNLDGWSFQFDYGTRRAGSCQYDQHVITMSYDYARYASEQEIHDTILHEIAHALVGKQHNHDDVWQAKARAIGCSARRCHDVQFTAPRYIMKCSNGCWVTTAERRRRNLVCKRCHSKVVYTTYTVERWKREQASCSSL